MNTELLNDCQKLINWYHSPTDIGNEKLSVLIENIEKSFSVAREEIETDVANLINNNAYNAE